VEERVLQLFQHLGIQQAHVAARAPADWQGLAASHPERIASLTLVCPRALNTASLGDLSPRLLVLASEQGPGAPLLRRTVEDLPQATLATLLGYRSGAASDLIAERGGEIGDKMLEFLSRMDRQRKVPAMFFPEARGEAAGILYQIQGSGPPLVLFPLEFAPSQWDGLLTTFGEHYCTITLGGAHLGSVATLEARGQGAYLDVLGRLVDEAQLEPGDKMLDVGCGTGVIDRWLAQRTNRANRITAVDISTYLLREAAALARQAGLEEVIEFREASGESLPFPDHSFNVTLSCTVIQLVDADQMLAEMVRVTRPGGRVAVIARGDDRPNLINLQLPGDLKARAEAHRGDSLVPQGCADASLYRHFHQAGLTRVKMFPQLATHTDRSRLQTMQERILPTLSPAEAREWRAAVAQARAEGTFFISELFHCAVGTKPVG